MREMWLPLLGAGLTAFGWLLLYWSTARLEEVISAQQKYSRGIKHFKRGLTMLSLGAQEAGRVEIDKAIKELSE